MNKLAAFFLLIAYTTFAQKGIYRRSDGDLLTGTWLCVKCKDTTVQAINFKDTVFTRTRVSSEGIQTDTCSYKVKKNKVFIKCDEGEEASRTRYRIVLIDINSLELKQWNKKSEKFKKSL